MKQYIIVGVLALTLILLIVGTTLITLNDFSIGNFSIISINSMKDRKTELQTSLESLELIKQEFDLSSINLDTAKNSYLSAKQAYDNVTEEQIQYIKDATKEDHYYIDWLWIVLGEYAEDNNLTMHVIDPREAGEKSSASGTVQLRVVGRYADIANFVFEVENDDELRFKLDNMSMEYSKDNKVAATFDVLSMEVLF